MIEKIKIGEEEKLEDLDLEIEEQVEECMLSDGDECTLPIKKFKIEGYKFDCVYEGCQEEFIGKSKDEVISKAKTHLVRHLDRGQLEEHHL